MLTLANEGGWGGLRWPKKWTVPESKTANENCVSIFKKEYVHEVVLIYDNYISSLALKKRNGE